MMAANLRGQSIPYSPVASPESSGALLEKCCRSGRIGTERLLKEYFNDPYRSRESKTNLQTFQHKITTESLRIDGWYNPGWVQDMLENKAKASTLQGEDRGFVEECAKAWLGVKADAFESQELYETNGWETLSLEEALTSMERMPQLFSVQNLTCILHKCRTKKSPSYAKRLHAHLCKSGLESNTSLGNYLVPMLVQVGSMSDAEQVFNKLVYPNVYSWTSLIMGYIEAGESQHAVNLYQKMQEDSVHPSKYTIVAILKACSRLKDAERGQEMHAEIARKGLDFDVFVGSTLVDVYAKCGLLTEAQEAIDKLPVRNIVSWTALMAGYAEHGPGEEALDCLEQMQVEGLSPNAVTFVCSLKACGSIGDIDTGQEIHAQIARKGLEIDLFVGNTLVDMYAKCGSLVEAQEAFDKLPVQDLVSWTALMGGYVEHGLGEAALNCLEQMQLEGLSPNAVTLVCSLQACASIGYIDKGREIHAEIARNGLERDLFVGSTLVDMYAKCGSLAEAWEVFDMLPGRNEVSWNALITGYAEQGLGEEAPNCFKQMEWEGLFPDAVTFVCSLKCCGNIGATDKGRAIHSEIARKRLERDLFIGSAVVNMYAKCGSLAEAREVFDKLPVRDVVSWTALIAGYAEQGLGEEALNCFQQMQLEGLSPDDVTFVCSLKACGSIGAIDKGREIHTEIAKNGLERDLFVGRTLVDMYAKCGSLVEACVAFDKLPVSTVVSWNSLIAGYAEHGLGEEALNYFKQMQLEGLSPDAVTFVCSLKACGGVGAIEMGREIHAEIARKGKGLERDLFVGNTLVDMYTQCGSLLEAHLAFDKLRDRDVVSWSAIIAGYAQLGESEIVFQMLERLKGEGIKPNRVIFSIVLTVCSHTGLVDKGRMYFDTMCTDYGITPTIEHHTGMVDLLCRAGQLEAAVIMVKRMPFHPNLVVWHTVLGACRKWGNLELGRLAFEHAVQLDEKDAATYVLMSNIYAVAHMEEEEKEVEAMRVKEQAWKKPGMNWWIDIGGTVNSFYCGGHNFPKAKIYVRR